MTSWRLWQSIGTPPRDNPLFRRWLAKSTPAGHRATAAFIGWAFACSGLTFCSLTVFEWIPYMVLLALFTLNTGDGARWAWRISQAIIAEKTHHRYELFAALPGGKLALCWAVVAGRIYESQSFRLALYSVKVMTGIMLVTLAGMIGFTLLVLNVDTASSARMAANQGVLRWGMVALPFAIAFFIDHRYALITGLIVGLVGQLDLDNRAEAGVRAILGYLCLQIGGYLGAYAVFVVGLPRWIFPMGALTPGRLVLLSFIGLVAYALLREAIVRWLWRYAVRNLDADSRDVQWALFGLHEADAPHPPVDRLVTLQ